MSQLIIMRHAQADSSYGGADFARPLTKLGHQQAAQQARWLATQDLQPHIVMCSPATRTRDTAVIVSDILKLDKRHGQLVQKIYEATAGDLIEVLDTSAHEANVLLIGHNPGVSALVSLLSGQYATMTPATIALLRLAPEPERRWDRESARLDGLQHPER